MDATTLTGMGLGFLLAGFLFHPFLWVGLGLLLLATLL